MGAWVPTITHPPPIGEVVLVRFGASVFFAGYSKWSGWAWVIPGGHEEKISDPPEWWSADAQSDDESTMSFEAHTLRRSKAVKQLSFVFRADSPTLSKTS